MIEIVQGPLTRTAFREAVFRRDKDCCVICGNAAQDAHHILERRLFTDGGYYLDNGASLCGNCHIAAETTALSCEEIRAACNIKTIVLPEHLYESERYDKWGNPILPSGQRLRGELFRDPSVQKILGIGRALSLFTSFVKAPRTYHLPWSPGVSNDDRVLRDLSGLEQKEVVVSLKMDGENTSMYQEGLHARSLEYVNRKDRDRIKALHASFAHDIPDQWRICGENVWAVHSIEYKDLEDFFYIFGIWNEANICLSWDETEEWAELLGLQTVPVLYRGIWTPEVHDLLINEHEKNGVLRYQDNEMEGYVVRVADEFPYSAFRTHVAKYVRKGHVTQAHWTRSIRPNQVRKQK